MNSGNYRVIGVSPYNYKPGNWGDLHQELLRDSEDPLSIKTAQEAGDKLRDRLLQDRSATSIITALLLTIAFGMLLLDPSTVKHKIMFSPNDREGVPFVIDPTDRAWTSRHLADDRNLGETLGGFQFGVVRAAYIFCCVVSSMLSILSVYISTWEYLLINRCPSARMIFLVQYLHDENRSRLSIAFEPWRATIGAAVALVLSMTVLVYALYGGVIWCLSVLTVVVMSAMGIIASRHLGPDTVFGEIGKMAEKAHGERDVAYQVS